MKFSILLILFLGSIVPSQALAEYLPVPFTLQAPEGKWVQPWADACEEAVTIMVDHYYYGDRSPRIAKTAAIQEIQRLVTAENKYLGFNKDTNAVQMISIINRFFPWSATVVHNPTLDQIKNEIDSARPVIALVHGKDLKNPYFRSGGPDYHTIVLKGYDDGRREFITNEPGVGRGLDYRYAYDTLLTALHDFVPQKKTKYGDKVAIFTSPLADENNIPDGSLVKLRDEPTVYLLESGAARKISNEEVFLAHGWKWNQIKIVGSTFLLSLFPGEAIDR